ncbi:MAG: carboxylating nicotinate-nucleotide diphosphorylase [Gammaproteobacteria bacterium]|nr:MAG: carboxylating nicotinate-nucleotide diphosphorylase [Gammaproteobacteria bacterium]
MHPKLTAKLRRYDWPKIISENVHIALQEDLGPDTIDVTAQLIDEHAEFTADLWVREYCRLAGQDWFTESFRQVSEAVCVEWYYQDGDDIPANSHVATVTGPARAILTAERTAINFLQTLSGTATRTANWQKKIAQQHTVLLDTRKTIPGLRFAQKYAVFCGGGQNHRIGLFDQFLIKENHIAAAGSIVKAIDKARKLAPTLKVEVEVENWEEFQAAVEGKADIIMLDNFTLDDIRRAIHWLSEQDITPRPMLEASGNISEDNLADYAATGVDYISSGALTKSVSAIDFSLRYRT